MWYCDAAFPTHVAWSYTWGFTLVKILISVLCAQLLFTNHMKWRVAPGSIAGKDFINARRLRAAKHLLGLQHWEEIRGCMLVKKTLHMHHLLCCFPRMETWKQHFQQNYRTSRTFKGILLEILSTSAGSPLTDIDKIDLRIRVQWGDRLSLDLQCWRRPEVVKPSARRPWDTWMLNDLLDLGQDGFHHSLNGVYQSSQVGHHLGRNKRGFG